VDQIVFNDTVESVFQINAHCAVIDKVIADRMIPFDVSKAVGVDTVQAADVVDRVAFE
jgi:hypothetical protein